MYIVLHNSQDSSSIWPLGAKPLVIGRSKECDIQVFDAALSRRHAKIWLEDGAVRFEDLGPSNATLVNGAPLGTGNLKAGDRLAAGLTVFQIVEHVDPRYNGPVSPIPTPVTLSARLTSYMRSPEETSFEPPSARQTHELHGLFHLGRALGSVASLRELAELLARMLRAEFEPGELWIMWRYADGEPLQLQPLEGDDPGGAPPLELLQRALDSHEGAVKPSVHCSADGVRRRQSTMAVPLIHGGQALGGLLLRSRAPGRFYAEDDLHFALGIAAIAAPHVVAVREAEQLRRDNQALQVRAGSGAHLLGNSPALAEARDRLTRAGNSALPVLILGETGTGKEIAARLVHDASPRHNGPYVVANCAAIPDHLFESEFFGHEKGAFTGATAQRTGRFEEAHGGTLFLDEIGDLSPDNQARILRAIETLTFHRVGGQKPIRVDVRIVAATNKTLEEPAFRRDLLHRLNGVTIAMPPLRDRLEDLPLLATHFIRLSGSHGPDRVTGIHPEALARLGQHDWPGNVRELKALIDRAILFARGTALTPEDLLLDRGGVYPRSTPAVPSCDTCDTSPLLSLADLERQHIHNVLKACDGNMVQSARILGINRMTLYRRLAEYKGK